MKRATDLGTRELTEMDRETLEAHIAAEEAPLIERLAALEDAPLTTAERKAEKQRIRDERAVIWAVRSQWRKLHRPADAGPKQVIGAGAVG